MGKIPAYCEVLRKFRPGPCGVLKPTSPVQGAHISVGTGCISALPAHSLAGSSRGAMASVNKCGDGSRGAALGLSVPPTAGDVNKHSSCPPRLESEARGRVG